ncbi:MAG TPA: fibronectin type III domain-containing protein [Solirubrobacteraceae bacterium]
MTSHGRRLPAPTRTIAPRTPNRQQSAARALLIAAAAALLLALTLAAPALAANPLPRGAMPGSFLHALPAKSTSPAGGALTGGFTPLVTGGNGETIQYHGGEVQHKPELEILWWGDNLFNGTQPFYEGVSLYTELKGFYDDLSNELEAPGEASWQGILSQYFGKSGSYGDAHVIAETDETAIDAPQNLTVSNIKKEITTWVNRGLGQNNNTQVIVVAAPGSSFAEDPEGGCAYHGIDEQGYPYTFLPYAGDLDHYFVKNKQEFTCNSRLAGKEVETTQLMWSTTAAGSHELAESESDPGLGEEYAWYSSKGEEVADLCAHEPIGSIELPEKNGRPGWWYVNELWDDGGGNTCKLEDPPYAEPSPPTATTEAATSIGYRQATLNGTLNPSGPEAHYDFEYGTTISYGSKIPTSEASAGFGTTTIAESATVTGLKPGTKYHFRIVAKTYAGTTAGADKEFTTPIPPPGGHDRNADGTR